LPQPKPLVSLIIDLRGELSLAHDLAQALAAKARYEKYELLMLHDDSLDIRALAWTEEEKG